MTIFTSNKVSMKEVNLLRNEVKKFIDSADQKTLKIIHAMLEADRETDWWDEVSDPAKASIERGLKDAAAGRVTSNDAVMKKYQKWLSK